VGVNKAFCSIKKGDRDRENDKTSQIIGLLVTETSFLATFTGWDIILFSFYFALKRLISEVENKRKKK
jgi:hypothetical protein